MPEETISLQCETCALPIGSNDTFTCSKRKEDASACSYQDISPYDPIAAFSTLFRATLLGCGVALPLFLCLMLIGSFFVSNIEEYIYIFISIALTVWGLIVVYSLVHNLFFRQAVLSHHKDLHTIKATVWRITRKLAPKALVECVLPPKIDPLNDLGLLTNVECPPSITSITHPSGLSMTRRSIEGLLAIGVFQKAWRYTYRLQSLGEFRLNEQATHLVVNYEQLSLHESTLSNAFLEQKILRALPKSEDEAKERLPSFSIEKLVYRGIFNQKEPDPDTWLKEVVQADAINHEWFIEQGEKLEINDIHVSKVSAATEALDTFSKRLAQKYPDFSEEIGKQIWSAFKRRTDRSDSAL